MVYNQQHMLLQWGGTFREGSTETTPAIEIFSGSLRFAGPGLAQSNNRNSLISLAIVLGDFFTSSEAGTPQNVFLDSVKWNLIGVDGLYADAGNTQEVTPTNRQGSTSPQYPPQVAWAMTWQTDRVRGRASRGRTFWPTAVAIGANRKVAPATCLATAQAGRNLIRDLNYAARNAYVSPARQDSPPSWAVDIGWAPGTVQEGSGVSAMVMSKIGSGTSSVINSVGVGDRLDVQRRRGNDMADVRYVAETPTP